MPELIKVKCENDIAIITLDNPPLNLLGPQILSELKTEVDRIGSGLETKVIILTGAGDRAFCGGGDRGLAKNTGYAQLEDGFISGRRFYDSVRECEVPVIAAVNGPAIGGGFALVASCDMIVASEKAVFALPEVSVGMWPQFRYLARLVPELKMRRMLFSAQRLTARELYRFGSIDEIVPAEMLMPTAMKIAQEIAVMNTHIVRLFKKAVNSAEGMNVKSSLQVEKEYIRQLVRLHDADEIRRSFQSNGA